MDNRSSFEQVIMRMKQPGVLNGETVIAVEFIKDYNKPYSLLKKVRIKTPKRQFYAYIKQYRLKEPGKEHKQFMIKRVEKDFQVTSKLYRYFSSFPRLNVPRPLAYFPELLVIVLEESYGEPFIHFLERHAWGRPSRKTMKQLLDYCERCGEWLRHFQQMLPSERQYSISEMWRYVDHRLKQLVDHPNAKFSKSLRHQVHRYFERLEACSDSLDLRMAAVHGDFCLGNILVHPSGVTVIDFAMFNEDSIYKDLAHFYHHLDLLLIKPIFRPNIIRQLQETFLKSYDPNFNNQNLMFEAFRLRNKTTHFLTLLHTSSAKLHERLYNRLVYQNHKKWIRMITR